MRNAELKKTALPREIGAILDIAPIDLANRSEWPMLTVDGRLIHVDAEGLEWKRLASSALLPEPDHEPWNNQRMRHRLHVSACGRFASVANDYGKHGLLMDLQHEVVTRELNGGEY